MDSKITVQTKVDAPIDIVWDCWTNPDHITEWSFASNDWEARDAEVDLQVGGQFSTVLRAKDGSNEFLFSGTYSNVQKYKRIEYRLDDGRHVSICFTDADNGVEIVQKFEPEHENSRELQKKGWQAFLNNFKRYTEKQM